MTICLAKKKSQDYYVEVKYDKILTTNLVLQNDNTFGFSNNFVCKSSDDLIQFLKKTTYGKEILFNEVSSD